MSARTRAQGEREKDFAAYSIRAPTSVAELRATLEAIMDRLELDLVRNATELISFDVKLTIRTRPTPK